MVKLVV